MPGLHISHYGFNGMFPNREFQQVPKMVILTWGLAVAGTPFGRMFRAGAQEPHGVSAYGSIVNLGIELLAPKLNLLCAG